MICMYSAGSPISQFVDSVSLTVSTTRANAIHCSWVSQFIRQARAHGSTWPKKNLAIQRTGWAFLTIYTMRGLRPVSLAWVDDSNCAGWILQRYLEDVVPSIFARNTTNSDTDPASLCSIEIPTSSMIALQGLAGVYSLDVWWLLINLWFCAYVFQSYPFCYLQCMKLDRKNLWKICPSTINLFCHSPLLISHNNKLW